MIASTRTRLGTDAAALAAAAAAAALIVGVAPARVAVAAAAAAMVVVVLRSPTATLSLMLSAAYFEGYLTGRSVSLVKVIGAAAFLSWAIDWLIRGRRIALPPQLVFVGALAIWLGVSVAVAHSRGAATHAAMRYTSFFALFFVTVQVASQGRRRAETLVTVAVTAAAISSAIGLYKFVGAHSGRAAGPLVGADDFAFLLSSTLPLAVWRMRWTESIAARMAGLAAILLIAGACAATLSRGAGLGVAAGVLWITLARRVRARWLLGALVVAGAAAAIGLTVARSAIEQRTVHKQQIASQNVQSRLYYWQIAFDEFKSAPITGVGGGNYRVRFPDFGLPFTFDIGAQGTHNTYLNILAELGLTGFLLFAGYLLSAWLALRRRFLERRADELQTALATGFITALVAAVFLTEQFYTPLWVLPALAVGTVVSSVRGGASP